MADPLNIVREVKNINNDENSDIKELLDYYGLDIPADRVFSYSNSQAGIKLGTIVLEYYSNRKLTVFWS